MRAADVLLKHGNKGATVNLYDCNDLKEVDIKDMLDEFPDAEFIYEREEEPVKASNDLIDDEEYLQKQEEFQQAWKALRTALQNKK